MVFATVQTPQPSTPGPHQYGTRIRSNSGIRPSIRLRQSSCAAATPTTPRRIKPAPTPKPKLDPVTFDAPRPDYPPFPPGHVMLHHDDANSKVFIAIGRSFMSVDNRAMTIKDLSEMTMKYGIMCQNVSAAGQAITTYIRNHLQRCEVQQDHPLLLRHVLSGTASDDDLLPALHSRTGGAHCALGPSENRVTNFRRGTMVWYLSRAAGVPCPFARCGIRLCEYGENGRAGSVSNQGREKKRERDRLRRAEQCGQKRKRLLRSAFADKESDSESVSEEEKRPPKVKLTLRLRPPNMSSSGSSLSAGSAPQSDHVPERTQAQMRSSPEIIDLSKDDDSGSESQSSDSEDTDDDSMSEGSSVSSDEDMPIAPSNGDLQSSSTYGAHVAFASGFHSPEDHRRSASASPPPDSEDEDNDFHVSMMGVGRYSLDRYSSWDDEDEDDQMSLDDNFWDLDNDGETQWESPGPRSPSAQFEDDVVVKEEPNDVGGLLEAWDDLDSKHDPKVVDVILRAAAGHMDFVEPKLEEELEQWGFPHFASSSSDRFPTNSIGDATSHIKQEETESGVSFLTQGLLTPPPDCASLDSSPISPVAPSLIPSTSYTSDRRNSSLVWRDAEVLGPDSVKPHDLAEGVWREGRRSSDVAFPAAEQAQSTAAPAMSAPLEVTVQGQQARAGVPPPPRLELAAPGAQGQGYLKPDLSSPSLLSSLTSLTIHTPTSPEALRSACSSRPPQPPSLVQDSLSQESLHGECSVIQTCQPCDPPVVATRLEGVSVYQMTLGSSIILRRADTNFVHADFLVKELGLSLPLPSPSNAVSVAKGSPEVCGTWLPLVAARELCKDHRVVAVFLSDQLPDRFPPTLKALASQLHRYSYWTSSFGTHFQSTIDAKRRSLSFQPFDFSLHDQDAVWWETEEQFLATHPTFAIVRAMSPTPVTPSEEPPTPELPLSPAEEKMFRELCSDAEWDTPSMGTAMHHVQGMAAEPSPAGPTKNQGRSIQDRQLRRSKRVADAIARRSQTRSSKRGSRSSLS